MEEGNRNYVLASMRDKIRSHERTYCRRVAHERTYCRRVLSQT